MRDIYGLNWIGSISCERSDWIGLDLVSKTGPVSNSAHDKQCRYYLCRFYNFSLSSK